MAIDPIKAAAGFNGEILGAVSKGLQAAYNGSALGGTFGAGDAMWKFGKMSVFLDQWAINPREMHKIDDFFTRFGYAQNRLIAPETAVRKSFTYLKTADESYVNKGLGNANSKQVAKINSILMSGVTFWNTDNITKQNIFKYQVLDNDTLD